MTYYDSLGMYCFFSNASQRTRFHNAVQTHSPWGDQISTNIYNLLQIARALPFEMSILPSYTCDDYQILSNLII